MSEWQPIETAPDSGPVLVCWFNAGEPKWMVRNAQMLAGQPYATDTPYSVRYLATHWMSLPPPPKDLK